MGLERDTSIYFGVNIAQEDKEKIINYARKKLNPDIKLYQMKVDEDAFHLKAEEINYQPAIPCPHNNISE